MKDAAALQATTAGSHPQRGHRQFGAVVVGHRVADQPNPGPRCGEVAPDQVRGEDRLAALAGQPAAPAPGDARDAALARDPLHLLPIDRPAWRRSSA